MIETITTTGGIDAVMPQLRDLWLRSASPTIFTSPEWMRAWWSSFGTGQLHAVAERDGATLLTFAPMFVRRAADGAPELTLVGAGNSDYLDVMSTHGEDVTSVVREVLDWSAQHGIRYAAWPQLRPDATLATAALPSGWGCALHDAPPSPVVALTWTDEEFDRQLSANLRTNLRRAREAAEARGRVRFEHVSGSGVPDALDTLFALHAARWQTRAVPGVLAGRGVQGFHQAVARAADSLGILRLIRLVIAREIAGVFYGFTTPAGACDYICGINPALASVSPGSLLTREAIHRAIDEGAAEFDFLGGCEPYKYQWGATDRRVLNCRLRHRSMTTPATALH